MANKQDRIGEFHAFALFVTEFVALSGGCGELDRLLAGLREADDAQKRKWLRDAIAEGGDATLNWILCTISLSAFLGARCEVVDGYVLIRALDSFS